MNRRSFLGAILATCTAPAIVRASSLMPMVARLRWPTYLFPRALQAQVAGISGSVLILSEDAGSHTLVNANVYKDMAPIISAALAAIPNGGTVDLNTLSSKPVLTKGSIAMGSRMLSVAHAADFNVGDWVLIEAPQPPRRHIGGPA